MLATQKQISYLQNLADRAEYLRRKHPSLIPDGLVHMTYELGLTSEKAGLRIQMYRTILDRADMALYPPTKSVLEDLPE